MRVQLDASFLTDPWQAYHDMAGRPVQHVAFPNGREGWLVTGYEEARTLLDDPRLSKDIREARTIWQDRTPPWARPALAEHMLHTDPPDHTRLRRLVNRSFTPRAVARLRASIETIAGDLLDAMGEVGQADLIDAFAFPLPIMVISELLGVPHADRDRLRAWSRDFVSRAPAEATARSVSQFSAYLAELIENKKSTPGDDLLSDLIQVSDGDERQLTSPELISMAFLLLVAGHETTVSLISTAVFSLLVHPEQMNLLRARPNLIAAAVEEALRYESPIHLSTLRFTTETVTVGEIEIPPRQFVYISLPAANRDPRRFHDPDEFDITRDTSGQLAFGHGVHFCVGAPLARLEGEIALRALLDRYETLELDGNEPDLGWRASLLVRGLQTLPVRYGGGSIFQPR